MTTLLEKPESPKTLKRNIPAPQNAPEPTPTEPQGRDPGRMIEELSAVSEQLKDGSGAVSGQTLAPAPSAPATQKKKRFTWKRMVVGALAVAALAAGAKYGWSYWQWAAVHETTDDAFIDGHVTQVTPRVAGHVLKVYVNDNQVVHAGDVLVELDPADFQAALAEAQGKLTAAQADLVAANGQVEQAKAQVTTAEAQVEQAKADEAAKQAEFERASQDLKNYTTAQRSGVVSDIELRKVQTDVRTTEAALNAGHKAVAAAEAQVAEAKATLQAREGQVAVSKAGIATAEAAVKTATLNLSYTQIKAATDGRVVKKNVEPGDYVIPAQMPALLGLVNNDVWVTANFKETQLAHMRAGEKVDLHVDAYPGVTFHGHVDSIQQGAGAYFSLMPPENATGNYVKVVQRVPVKITIDDADSQHLLGPGMSVVPEVEIR
jgi:membrane fusion protein, multidrug efflux system